REVEVGRGRLRNGKGKEVAPQENKDSREENGLGTPGTRAKNTEAGRVVPGEKDLLANSREQAVEGQGKETGAKEGQNVSREERASDARAKAKMNGNRFAPLEEEAETSREEDSREDRPREGALREEVSHTERHGKAAVSR